MSILVPIVQQTFTCSSVGRIPQSRISRLYQMPEPMKPEYR